MQQYSIMSTSIFAALLLIVGITIFYLTQHNSQAWHWLSTFYPPRAKISRDTKSGGTKPFLTSLPPYQLPPLKPRTSSRMAMGLKRLDQINWLTIDNCYHTEHKLRAHMLQHFRPNVLQCLPGSEAACHEVLDLVTSFLSGRFPEYFTINPSSSMIQNHLTKECHLVGDQCPDPMEIAARLAMEDFNILVKDPKSGEYLLKASATLFPAGWQLQKRIGTSIANLHSPVPGWEEKLGAAVSHYFDRLSPNNCMERYNLFIQTTNKLFQDGPEIPSTSTTILRPENITVRRERQTFTRLEKTGAVLFTVRTYMKPLVELEGEEIGGLLSQIRGWEGEMKTYKGGDHWGSVVEEWCESQVLQQTKDIDKRTEEDCILRERKLSV